MILQINMFEVEPKEKPLPKRDYIVEEARSQVDFAASSADKAGRFQMLHPRGWKLGGPPHTARHTRTAHQSNKCKDQEAFQVWVDSYSCSEDVHLFRRHTRSSKPETQASRPQPPNLLPQF